MDDVMAAPLVTLDPGPRYQAGSRLWQGIPGIERSPAGRLWATWYSGGKGEGNDNYVLLCSSGDEGRTWSTPTAVIDPPGAVRAFDPMLWTDPLGRLWWFWAQTCPMPGQIWDGRGGVWCIVTENPDDACPRWSEPRRLSHGIAMNKPIVTAEGAGGAWLIPAAVWGFFDHFRDLEQVRRPGVVASTDAGATWAYRGGAIMDERSFDEHMVVQRRDGTLWMLARAQTGITESYSMDEGYSWSRGRPSMFAGPSSRFHFRRLRSGRLMLINHLGNPGRTRSHLTVLLSDDDGATWPHRLLLDERTMVSYPDATEGPDGTHWIIYDRDRYGAREILMACLTEDDIVAGRIIRPGSALRMTVERLG